MLSSSGDSDQMNNILHEYAKNSNVEIIDIVGDADFDLEFISAYGEFSRDYTNISILRESVCLMALMKSMGA